MQLMFYETLFVILSIACLGLLYRNHSRAKKELMLAKETEHMRQILNYISYTSEGIYGLDLEGYTTFSNKAAEEMLGYTLEEMVNKSQHDLIHHHYPDGSVYPRERCNIYHAFRDGKVHTEADEVFWRKDGFSFPVEYTSSPTRDGKGKITGAVVVFRDITERKLAEKQLREYAVQLEEKNRELTVAKKQAEQATGLKSEFLANMSHEIRTPMNGIIGMANLLLDCDLKTVERDYVQNVIHSADALLQIINDILDFSKIEAGKIDMEEIPFDLQLLCEEVCEIMAIKANEKKVELLLRYPYGTSRFCIGDPGRVRQILFNLLSNAIKFTDNGYVVLSLQSVTASDGKLKIHVEVEDTGVGIPADKIQLIFDKFSQADQSTARKFGGTGLGLSICKELTRMMQGDIGVRSVYGVGSTFWFDIVLTEDKAGASRFVVPQETVLQGLRVLMVDDNKIARTIVRENLTPHGVKVVETSSGKEALDIVKNDQNFDIAIFDFLMPEMDGMELGRRMKENPATQDIALLILTSAPNRGDKEQMKKIGFAGYLSKPLAHWHLCDALSVIAEARKLGRKIPVITQHNLKEAKAGEQIKANANLQFANVHILLAEDNPVNQTVATALLGKYGCRVTPAADGEEAVKQLKQRNFDLVFMDCQMPMMDGYEATHIIRKLEEHQKRPHIPIVAFTANVMKGDQEKCLAAGMDDYISKPVRQADIERILIQWLPEKKRCSDLPDKTELINHTSHTTLDMAIFHAFAELMEENLSAILTRHLEVVQGYLRSIRDALDAGNFKAASKAAHPLKSSSQQIGAIKVSAIAREIENGANAAFPDIVRLKTLIGELEQAQAEAKQALTPYLGSGKVA